MRNGSLAGGRLSYLFLSVRDYAGMLAFYRDVLGFAVEFEAPGEIAFLRLEGDTGPRIAISVGDTPEPSAARHWFLVIDVTGIDAVADSLRSQGLEIGDIEDVPYGRAVIFPDPEGNLLEIHEPS